MGQIIEFLAFLHLRAQKPALYRPYKIPLGLFGCSVMLSFPLLFIGIIIYFSDRTSLLFTGVCALLGVLVFYLLKAAKRYEWCEFVDVDEDAHVDEMVNDILAQKEEHEMEMSRQESERAYLSSNTGRQVPS
jgi:hypothetical protein